MTNKDQFAANTSTHTQTHGQIFSNVAAHTYIYSQLHPTLLAAQWQIYIKKRGQGRATAPSKKFSVEKPWETPFFFSALRDPQIQCTNRTPLPNHPL